MKIEKANVFYGVSMDEIVFSYSDQPAIARAICEKTYESPEWLVFYEEEHARRAQKSFDNPDMHPIVKVVVDYTIEELNER